MMAATSGAIIAHGRNSDARFPAGGVTFPILKDPFALVLSEHGLVPMVYI